MFNHSRLVSSPEFANTGKGRRGWSGALDFLMASDSGQGAIRIYELTFAAQISLTQNELNEVAHGDGMDWF
jgi:hypothetical protein